MNEGGWQRLSPVAVVFYLLSFVRQLIGNGWAVLAPAVAWAATLDGGDYWKAVLAAAVLLGLGLLFAVLSYLRFRFRTVADGIQVRRGIWHREHLTVEIARVQNVNLREPFYVRPFDLVIMELETAGSTQKEIALGGIPGVLARALREQVIQSRNQPQPHLDPTEATASHRPECLLSLGHKEVIIYGLCHNLLLWLALAAALFGDAMDNYIERLGDVFMGAFQWFNALSTGARLLLTASGILMLLMLFSAAAVVIAYWRFHRYRLLRDGETYTRSSGLLNRYEQSLRRHQVQAAELVQNPLMRIFGRANLYLRQVSAGVSHDQLAAALTKNAFLVPAVTPATAITLCREVLPDSDLAAACYTRPHRRFIRKVMTLNVGLVAPLIVTGWAVAINLWLLALIPAVLMLAYPLVWLRWYRHGYAIVGGYAMARKGFIGCRYTLFPLFRIQRVDLQQSPSQRRHGLANVTIHLPSHSVTLYYLELEHAQALCDLALYSAESSAVAWI